MGDTKGKMVNAAVRDGDNEEREGRGDIEGRK